MDPKSTKPYAAPKSIIIIGSGCFGLSTALALSSRPAFAESTITLIDQAEIPNKESSSYDVNRIARSDYSNPLYTALATKALNSWRDEHWGENARYNESGLLMVGDAKTDYLTKALDIARANGRKDDVLELLSESRICEACKTGGSSGGWGYLSRGAGWVDAEKSITYAFEQAKQTGRVKFVQGKVVSLKFASTQGELEPKVEGVLLEDGQAMQADLTIVAAGPFTPMLLSMKGAVAASADVFAYIELTEHEALRLRDMPAIINLSKGWFIIPPRGNTLKIARHGRGFVNQTSFKHPESGEQVTISTPDVSPKRQKQILEEGLPNCRQALEELIPWLASRSFDRTRLCWYTDTPTADFIIDYHPQFEQLFVATG